MDQLVGATKIKLLGTAPAWLYDGDDYDKTYFSIGENHRFIRDYIVTSIKPNGDEITIEATNYDEDIYT